MHNYIVFATVCIYLPGVFTIHGRMPIFFHFQDLWSIIHNRPTCVASIPSTASRIMWRTWLPPGDRSPWTKWSVFFVGSCLRNFYFGSTKFKMQRLEHPTWVAVGGAMDKLETPSLFFLLGKAMGKSSGWACQAWGFFCVWWPVCFREVGFIWEDEAFHVDSGARIVHRTIEPFNFMMFPLLKISPLVSVWSTVLHDPWGLIIMKV